MFLRVPISKGSPGNKVSKPAQRPESLSENVSADQRATFTSSRSAYTFGNVRISAPGEDTTSGGQTPGAPKQLPGAMKAKLKLGALDDPLEHEAERVAEQVMRMPEAAEKPKDAQGKLTAGDFPERASTPSAVPLVVHEVLGSPGQPLDSAARAFFEPRFGHDFSRIRVHTDARAAESARAVGARAYTVGHQIVFGSGQYGSTAGEHARLMAHELAHVTQQGASPSAKVLRRQPQQSTVHVGKDVKELPQGAGGSGAIIYEYTARAMREPADKSDHEKPGKQFEIDLPLLVYAPANIDTTKTPPKVSIFVFFHGMRATYEEGSKAQAAQGEEPIAIWTHLKEAVAGSDRVGIAPQAPRTWVFSNRTKSWVKSTAQWNEALGKVGFDGLINIALEKLSKDLGLKTALVAGDIHVAGHSAGGQGIIQATSHGAGASAFSDAVQDVTLQDAGYNFQHWDNLMDWLLDGSPGKTVRVLVSHAEGGTAASPGNTRSILTNFLNAKKINDSIKAKKKSDDLEAVEVAVPKPEDQKPRPGGFVLESEMVVNNKKTAGVTQGTIVVFFSPGGKHYPTVGASMAAAAAAGPKTTTDFLGEAKPGKYRVIGDQDEKSPVYVDKDLGTKARSLPRDTVVEVTALEMKTPAGPKDKATQPYIANIKTADGKAGWMRLSNLTRE